MKATRFAVCLILIRLLPAVVDAGTTVARPSAPALGEAGLVALGIGLLGAGVALLRRRNR